MLPQYNRDKIKYLPNYKIWFAKLIREIILKTAPYIDIVNHTQFEPLLTLLTPVLAKGYGGTNRSVKHTNASAHIENTFKEFQRDFTTNFSTYEQIQINSNNFSVDYNMHSTSTLVISIETNTNTIHLGFNLCEPTKDELSAELFSTYVDILSATTDNVSSININTNNVNNMNNMNDINNMNNLSNDITDKNIHTQSIVDINSNHKEKTMEFPAVLSQLLYQEALDTPIHYTINTEDDIINIPIDLIREITDMNDIIMNNTNNVNNTNNMNHVNNMNNVRINNRNNMNLNNTNNVNNMNMINMNVYNMNNMGRNNMNINNMGMNNINNMNNMNQMNNMDMN
eukprot:73280_1